MANIGINPDNHITFTCETKGCNNIKTEYLSVYNKSKIHHCSAKCYYINQENTRKNKYNRATREAISTKIREYFKGIKDEN